MTLWVVTGAPGWLGTPLVEALHAGAAFGAFRAEARRGLCRVQPGLHASALERLGPGMEVVRADLRHREALRGLRDGATNVFHAAGVVDPRRVSDPYDVNVSGTPHLIDAAIDAGVKRLVLLSSNSPAELNESAARLMTEPDPRWARTTRSCTVVKCTSTSPRPAKPWAGARPQATKRCCESRTTGTSRTAARSSRTAAPRPTAPRYAAGSPRSSSTCPGRGRGAPLPRRDVAWP